MLKEKERAVKISLTSTKTTPALEDAEKLAVPIKTKKEAAAASSSTNDPSKGNPKAKAKSEAASVLPKPSLKSHADKKNKKGKGKGGRSSSPIDKKKIFCNYFFNKGGCNKGNKYLYSYSQKVCDARIKDKKGRSRNRDSSRGKNKGNSSSAGPKKKTCWQWQKGTYTFRSKYKFLHADQSPSTASERTSKKTTKKNATPITIDSFFDSNNEDAMGYTFPRIASAKKSSDYRRISFDMNPDMHKIYIEDYQEGMPNRIHRESNKPNVPKN